MLSSSEALIGGRGKSGRSNCFQNEPHQQLLSERKHLVSELLPGPPSLGPPLPLPQTSQAGKLASRIGHRSGAAVALGAAGGKQSHALPLGARSGLEASG